MDNQTLRQRYIDWLGYWANAIRQQHIADQGAEVGDDPLYKDDVDQAINGVIVASLLERIDGMEQQFIKGTE